MLGSGAVVAPGGCDAIAVVESKWHPRRKTLPAVIATFASQANYHGPAWPIPSVERIESFACRRGRLLAERRNRGYTLIRADTGAPVARLRQTGREGRVEVLYWSLWKERWTSAGPFGRTILPLDDALLIASEDIFWATR